MTLSKKSLIYSISNLYCCLNNDEMFCLSVLPRRKRKRKHATSVNCDSLSAIAVYSYLNFQQQIRAKRFDTYASVWFAATTRNHSALCRTKKEWTMTKNDQSPSILLNTALLNRGLKYISMTKLFRRIYSVSSSGSAKTPTIHVERVTPFSWFSLAFPKSIAVRQSLK